MTHVCLALIVGIILIFSAVTLGCYNNFVSAQSQPPGIGQCRGFNDVKPRIYQVTEHCGIPAPSNQPVPKNPCSDKAGTIFWPSSGGCVPPFCPPGGNREVRGARLNNGDCDPNFGSGSSVNGNNNTNNQFPSGAAAAPAIAAGFPIGYVPNIQPSYPPGYVGPEGVVPAEPPVYEAPIEPPLPDWWPPAPSIPSPPIVVPGEVTAEGGAAAAEGGAALAGEGGAAAVTTIGAGTVAALAAGAVAAFSVGWWIGCGGEFC